MSGTKLNLYSIGDENITALMNTANKLSKGFHRVSLSEWETATVPQITAGSIFECAGSIFEFASDESISGSPPDGTIYIKLIPAGSVVTAEWTSVAPVWDDSYQGFYSSTPGEEIYRYIGGATKSGSNYYGKFLYSGREKMPSRYDSKYGTGSTGALGMGTFSIILTFTKISVIEDILSLSISGTHDSIISSAPNMQITSYTTLNNVLTVNVQSFCGTGGVTRSATIHASVIGR